MTDKRAEALEAAKPRMKQTSSSSSAPTIQPTVHHSLDAMVVDNEEEKTASPGPSLREQLFGADEEEVEEDRHLKRKRERSDDEGEDGGHGRGDRSEAESDDDHGGSGSSGKEEESDPDRRASNAGTAASSSRPAKVRKTEDDARPTGGKYGQAGRQKKRANQVEKVRSNRRTQASASRALGSDYLVNDHGDATRIPPGQSTGYFYNRARHEQQHGIDQPVGFGTLAQRGQSVVSLASSFIDDRANGVDVTNHGQAVGSLTRSHLPWFNMPANADSHPGEPTAFASPLDSEGHKLRTTYSENSGVYSATSFGSTSAETSAQRTLVSAAEAVRGPGAGLAQVLAEDVRGNGAIASRNQMYGTPKGGPGYLPGGYGGSQSDIVLTDDHARHEQFGDILENPTGQQTENVLSDNRHRRQQEEGRRRRLTRSLSNPDLTASSGQMERDTEATMAQLGLGGDPHDLERPRPAVKRRKSFDG